MLQQAIARNREKWKKWRKYEAVLRRIRLRIFEYQDAGKMLKAERIMLRCKQILKPMWEAR